MNYDISECAVLVVDPHQHMRTLLSDILRQFGVRKIAAAPNADDAFKTFCEEGADLILTDWSPSLNAPEFVHTVRHNPHSKDFYVPVITVTAYCDLPHVYAARDAGIHDFIAKPFKAQHLYSRIRSLIENPRLFIRIGRYFGPDRRRRRMAPNGDDRRKGHSNRSRCERRNQQKSIPHPERRGKKIENSRTHEREPSVQAA